MDDRPFQLAFIDPGLRKAPFFLELRRHLAPRIDCLYYSRRTIVRGFARSAGAKLFPPIPTTAGRFEFSEQELREAVGAKELKLRPAKALRRARTLLPELSRFLEASRVDAILVWNGSNLILSLAVYLARRRGLPVVYAEHGYLPATLQLDREGVNCESSITALAKRGDALLPPDPVLDAALDREIAGYRSGQPTRVLNAEVPVHLRRDLRSALPRLVYYWARGIVRRNPPATGCDQPQLPERFVLLPFQVRKDSQLLLHSPVVGNDMEQLLSLLHAALPKVDPGLRIVVKLHPLEHRQVQQRYDELIQRFPDVLFIRKARVPDLLEKAAAVVTVNSSVGFEAFLFDKPVVALGHNFYTMPDLVQVVNAAGQLQAALAAALSQPVDRERRRAFLRYVYGRFLTVGSYHDYSEASFKAVAARIVSLLGLENGSAHPPLVGAAGKPWVASNPPEQP